MGKVGIKKCDTNITSHGGGSAPGTFNVLETQGGQRSVGGLEKTIKSSATTGEVCNTGDIVKYLNLFIQSSPRVEAAVPDQAEGWIEWALIMVKETETTVAITNVGTQTLGCICQNMFRNECIYTGQFPIGLHQPNSMAITIKVPKFKQQIRLGDEWRFIHWFRSWDSTDSSTDSCRTIKSFMYKCYS